MISYSSSNRIPYKDASFHHCIALEVDQDYTYTKCWWYTVSRLYCHHAVHALLLCTSTDIALDQAGWSLGWAFKGGTLSCTKLEDRWLLLCQTHIGPILHTLMHYTVQIDHFTGIVLLYTILRAYAQTTYSVELISDIVLVYCANWILLVWKLLLQLLNMTNKCSVATFNLCIVGYGLGQTMGQPAKRAYSSCTQHMFWLLIKRSSGQATHKTPGGVCLCSRQHRLDQDPKYRSRH